MTKELMVATYDGTELFFKEDLPAAPKAMILIVHGLCEHLGRYDYVTERLVAAGMGVSRFDHRGHGKSKGTRVFFDDYNQIADDVNHMAGLVKKAHPNLPLFLLGHSMGGFAVALFGTKYPGTVRGFILSGALTRYNHPVMGPLPIDAPPDHYVPNALGSGVCSDPAVVEAYGKDPLVEKEISIGLINNFHWGVQYLKENPTRFTDPVFLLHGCKDGLVGEKDSRDFFGEIGSDDKSLKIYSNLFHEILNEPCKDVVIDELLAWVAQRI